MGHMNTDWHEAHVLGSNAKLDERVIWHTQHAEKCACRPVPLDVQQEIDRRRPANPVSAG